MPTQKVFKQRVRARMTKTGESYTAARSQLLRKATADEARAAQPAPTAQPAPAPAGPPPLSDAATIRATGRSQEAWYALIDAAGIARDGHTAVARWLVAEHGVGGWWSQSITVGYERSRGLRAPGQMADGFTTSATRTIAASVAEVLAAFADEDRRARWLHGVAVRARKTTAASTLRFDWDEPASRLVVNAVPKGDGRSILSLSHERLPDQEAASRMKAFWRGRLAELPAAIERARES